jgi:hypothetical protein
VVPTGVGTCRQFNTGVQTAAGLTAAAAPRSGSKSLQSMLSDLKMWARSNMPMWMLHMFSHQVFDADIAIQSGVDRNRWVGCAVLSCHIKMYKNKHAGDDAN